MPGLVVVSVKVLAVSQVLSVVVAPPEAVRVKV